MVSVGDRSGAARGRFWPLDSSTAELLECEQNFIGEINKMLSARLHMLLQNLFILFCVKLLTNNWCRVH